MRCSTTGINLLLLGKDQAKTARWHFHFILLSQFLLPLFFSIFWRISPPHVPSCLSCPPLQPLAFALPVPYDTAAAVAAVCLPSGFLPGTVLPWTLQQRGCSRLNWRPFLTIGKNVCVEIAFPIENKRVWEENSFKFQLALFGSTTVSLREFTFWPNCWASSVAVL